MGKRFRVSRTQIFDYFAVLWSYMTGVIQIFARCFFGYLNSSKNPEIRELVRRWEKVKVHCWRKVHCLTVEPDVIAKSHNSAQSGPAGRVVNCPWFLVGPICPSRRLWLDFVVDRFSLFSLASQQSWPELKICPDERTVSRFPNTWPNPNEPALLTRHP